MYVCILWQVIIETSRYKTRILFQIMLDIILLSHIFHITIELSNKDIKVLLIDLLNSMNGRKQNYVQTECQKFHQYRVVDEFKYDKRYTMHFSK